MPDIGPELKRLLDYALIAAISSCIPHTLDLLLDYVLKAPSIEAKQSIMSRFMLLVLSLLFNLLVLLYLLPQGRLHSSSYIFSIRETIYVIIISRMLLQSKVVTNRNMAILPSILCVISTILIVTAGNVSTNYRALAAIECGAIAVRIIGALQLLYICFSWLYYFNSDTDRNVSDGQSVLYVISIILFLLCCGALHLFSWIHLNRPMSVIYMIGFTILEAGFAVLLAILNGHVIRHEAVVTKVTISITQTHRYHS